MNPQEPNPTTHCAQCKEDALLNYSGLCDYCESHKTAERNLEKIARRNSGFKEARQ